MTASAAKLKNSGDQLVSIPVINISPYLEGSPDDRLKVAREINKACEEIGFFIIVGHGVEQGLIDRTYSIASEFFRLPVDEKIKIRQPDPAISRGYTPVKGESLSAGLGMGSPGDLKEMIDMGPVDVPGDEYYERPEAGNHFHPNLWPGTPDGFEETMKTYYRRINRLANDLMGLFALALDLPEDFFFDKLDRNMSALRIICYPEQAEQPEPGQVRAGAHTDYGTLTILMSDQSAGGLQAQHRDGYWVDVVPEPGSYVINIGDVMQMWTNDRWVSTLHRVVNPPRDVANTARRHSVVFFHQPNYDAAIETLSSCHGRDRPKKYDSFTYGEHWTRKWMATKK
ncbi:isopenicillin N synthase family oxygenase [Mesorhizobium sp. CGMCC 1.15528]|uniref:2-oxoglutarate-dependent ethylene/succinate-forming enzyme n=1 Tax=Mesorhizobium zhangyense TaxID=1776730 RepID=A0A7C9RB82_9HYPH|nr:isopenicillin N synthase family oxygenase [Mesorhizobium zhangyense]NGN44536.1 isopenicillin N synthase family oxygenase [Mesorhizobium zhangyense]